MNEIFIKLKVGTCFKFEEYERGDPTSKPKEVFFIITKGYIKVITGKNRANETVTKLINISTNLKVRRLDWKLIRCDVVPKNDFIDKQYYYRDFYQLEEVGDQCNLPVIGCAFPHDIDAINRDSTYKTVKWKDEKRKVINDWNITYI